MSLLLGIDTTFINRTSIALYSLQKHRIEYNVDTFEPNSSEGLLPLLYESLRLIDSESFEISSILINNGPGSFTGIRTSIAAALGISYAINVPVYSIEDFKHFASNIVKDDRKVYVFFCQANIKENYIVSYMLSNNILMNIDKLKIISAESLNAYIDKLQAQHNFHLNDVEVINISEPNQSSARLLCDFFVSHPESFKILNDDSLNTENKISPQYIKGVNALTLKERGL